MSDSPPETPGDLRREDVAPRQRARASVGARRQLRERLERREPPLRVGLESWRDRSPSGERTRPGGPAIRRRPEERRDHPPTRPVEPAAGPTNDRAGRSRRPAVIARESSCGHEAEADARAFEVPASPATTCRQRSEDVISHLAARPPRAATVSPIPSPSR